MQLEKRSMIVNPWGTHYYTKVIWYNRWLTYIIILISILHIYETFWGKNNNTNNNGEFLYIATYHVQYILKTLLTLLPQQACVMVIYILFSISILEHTVPMDVDYSHLGYNIHNTSLPNVRYKWVHMGRPNAWPEV